jgi:hypothetical protein
LVWKIAEKAAKWWLLPTILLCFYYFMTFYKSKKQAVKTEMNEYVLCSHVCSLCSVNQVDEEICKFRFHIMVSVSCTILLSVLNTYVYNAQISVKLKYIWFPQRTGSIT